MSRTAIITGASRGIGLGIAQALVAAGDRVCLTARGADTLAEAVESLGGPEHAIAVAGKAHDPGHQDEAIARTIETFGPIDVLVNNTGTNPVFGPVIDLDPAVARKMLDINFMTALEWTQKVHKASMAERGGAIVNVSSVAGLRPAPGLGFYGATKAAMIHLTAQLAAELAPDIRVNAVAPAIVKTRFASALYADNERQVAETYPLGRLGEVTDVASAVRFLLSDEASWITGQTIVLDGGMTLLGGLT
ncbi:MAG TPA: SDR family oxidoreductase [Stackebrandtia sp.]|jgi:3-oxoacyl-[acyl-carrier protein] reductase|uniref:SDR family oxidoreductase n=1 Tax=Stackebrandtia sp. TaxID=2023065 RepID=UPI002D2D2982|nr:SDR family oxidoreductase [Stackebrandtia sp.]HZE37958.1 SDR family oxidoreductase [Stackebrandtia sp.]